MYLNLNDQNSVYTIFGGYLFGVYVKIMKRLKIIPFAITGMKNYGIFLNNPDDPVLSIK